MKNKMVQQLKELVPNNKEIVYVCIGTPKVLADSLAPLFGTLIKQRNLNIEVYGDLHDSVNATNINDINRKIPKDKFVITISSCAAKRTNIDRGKIIVAKGSASPGTGIGKTLDPIGDVVIRGITVTMKEDILENNCTLTDLYDMANFLVDTIEEFENNRRM